MYNVHVEYTELNFVCFTEHVNCVRARFVSQQYYILGYTDFAECDLFELFKRHRPDNVIYI